MFSPIIVKQIVTKAIPKASNILVDEIFTLMKFV